ncbi:MAG TPA: DEAD/DEAH box helicase [Gemmatimonadaceae bacterium]|nr:DEAD/DEAH box helicase [Gemmatimonadaceae bacterium]
MDGPLKRAPGALVRAAIARACLARDSQLTVGSITLRSHQCDAVERARAALQQHGGTLIADDVGLGKTFIALALASEARRPLVIGPAALRPMWAGACAQTGVRAGYRSYEALSRSPMPTGQHDLVILDEAHHARTPTTSRYRHLAQGLVGAGVVMLSATPIHNGIRDLRALLALFLGALAWTIDEEELGAYVIRREQEDIGVDAPLPALESPRLLALSDDAELLDSIVSLPPPVPPRDGGDGGALLSFTLARLWASSHFALRAALSRRLQRARALEDALACGRYPTRAELRAWAVGADATQLAFPELVTGPHGSDVGELSVAVRTHAEALETLVGALPPSSSHDHERAERIREVLARHRGEKVVAFTQFADTATVLFRLLRDDLRACQLDGRGGLVAGGRLSRREALARFAPRASGTSEPAAAERIDLLITTDLVSEGVNLHDASVVVHLDLPWTSARMSQRVGRSRRLGARHASTVVYAFSPPAGAETLLRQEERLREKLQAAARLTGVCGVILPVRLSLGSDLPTVQAAPVRDAELLRGLIGRWRDDASPRLEPGLAVARVLADVKGALALVRRGPEPLLMAMQTTGVSDRPADILAAARCAEGDDYVEGDADEIATALTRLEAWLATRAGANAAGIGHTIAGAARRTAMQRLAQIAARTPHHHRAQVAPLAAEARRIITAPYGVGAERILAELAGSTLPDEAWLRAVRAFGEANCGEAGDAGGARGAGGAGRIEAIILFGP